MRAHNIPAWVQLDDAAMIRYTSGTIGRPKGALLHHCGLVDNAALVLHRMALPGAPVWIGTMPLFHTGGCGLATLGVVSALDTQALVEAYDPALVLTLTHQHRAHVMVGVPAMLIANLGHPDFARTGSPFTIVCGQTECSPGPR